MEYNQNIPHLKVGSNLYTRVKVDGTVTMYWFVYISPVLTHLLDPFGDCAMYFDHGVTHFLTIDPSTSIPGHPSGSPPPSMLVSVEGPPDQLSAMSAAVRCVKSCRVGSARACSIAWEDREPIGSMYGIFTYIWLIFMVNVGKYTIHGSCGGRERWRFKRSFMKMGSPQKLQKNPRKFLTAIDRYQKMGPKGK